MATAFGIDIGGSGVKGALVDLASGTFIGERVRIPTPENAGPEEVGDIVAEIYRQFALSSDIPVGIAFPAPIRKGIVPFVANLGQDWVGVNLEKHFAEKLGRPVVAMNDADAAGYGEYAYGAAHGANGVVIVTTLGTGIGSAIIVNGTLLPNTELGHLEIDGKDAESRASARVRKSEDLSFPKWAKRLQKYYSVVDKLFSPDIIIVGGGVSKRADEFLPLLDLPCQIVAAELRNTAGIVGAARLAAEHDDAKRTHKARS